MMAIEGQSVSLIFANIDSILTVEDNLADFLLLQAAFRRANFKGQLERAATAEEAYQWFFARLESGGEPPDMIILDLGLPDESGMEMLRKLKGAPQFAEIFVVVYSGSDSHSDMAKARQLGADWYFVKQHKPKDLDLTVRTLVQLFQDRETTADS